MTIPLAKDNAKIEPCMWEPILPPLGWWETDCGDTFKVDAGTLEDNRIEFCPYCGHPVQEKKLRDNS